MRTSVGARLRGARGIIASVAVFALVLALVMGIVGNFARRADERQLQMVHGAVKRAALTCYAVEGHYPQKLDYLREHYGLRYDAERCLVVYDAFASNIMPGIRVIARGLAGTGGTEE